MAEVTAPSGAGTILDVVKGDDGLGILASAVGRAEISGTLSAEGPYTLFAPTDEAFAELGEGALDRLGVEGLTRVLTYHLVEGELDAADLIAAAEEAGGGGHSIKTIGGDTLTATMRDGALILTDSKGVQAMVLATDVEGSNGLVHVIDAVLMP